MNLWILLLAPVCGLVVAAFVSLVTLSVNWAHKKWGVDAGAATLVFWVATLLSIAPLMKAAGVI